MTTQVNDSHPAKQTSNRIENTCIYEDTHKFKVTVLFEDNQPQSVDATHLENVAELTERICRKRLKDGEWEKLSASQQNKRRMGFLCSIGKWWPEKMGANISVKGLRDIQIECKYALNNDANGEAYKDKEGHGIRIMAGTASDDRDALSVGSLRCLSEGKVPICYTGRPNTERKAKEQARFVFEHEYGLGGDTGRGIVKQRDGSYEFTYFVNSFISAEGGIGHVNQTLKDEAGWLKDETEHLQELQIRVVIDGQERLVRCKPILVPYQFNLMYEFSEALGNAFTGRGDQNALAAKGLRELQRYASTRKALLEEGRSSRDTAVRVAAIRKWNIIEKCEKKLAHFTDLLPEEKALYLILLCKALDLPTVAHCVSSKDRTGTFIAIASALQQWPESSLEESCDTLLQNDLFKEAFAAHLLFGHQNTRLSRGSNLEIDGEQLQNETRVGYSLKHCPVAARLLPERYLTTHYTQAAAMCLLLYLGGVLYIIFSLLRVALGYLGLLFMTGNSEEYEASLNHWVDDCVYSINHFGSLYTRTVTTSYDKDSPFVHDRQLLKVKDKPILTQEAKELIHSLFTREEEIRKLTHNLKARSKNPDVGGILKILTQNSHIIHHLLHNKRLAGKTPSHLHALFSAYETCRREYFSEKQLSFLEPFFRLDPETLARKGEQSFSSHEQDIINEIWQRRDIDLKCYLPPKLSEIFHAAYLSAHFDRLEFLRPFRGLDIKKLLDSRTSDPTSAEKEAILYIAIHGKEIEQLLAQPRFAEDIGSDLFALLSRYREISVTVAKTLEERTAALEVLSRLGELRLPVSSKMMALACDSPRREIESQIDKDCTGRRGSIYINGELITSNTMVPPEGTSHAQRVGERLTALDLREQERLAAMNFASQTIGTAAVYELFHLIPPAQSFDTGTATFDFNHTQADRRYDIDTVKKTVTTSLTGILGEGFALEAKLVANYTTSTCDILFTITKKPQ